MKDFHINVAKMSAYRSGFEGRGAFSGENGLLGESRLFHTHLRRKWTPLRFFLIESELFARPLRGKVILGESRELFP